MEKKELATGCKSHDKEASGMKTITLKNPLRAADYMKHFSTTGRPNVAV